jgi:hypothetical protein
MVIKDVDELRRAWLMGPLWRNMWPCVVQRCRKVASTWYKVEWGAETTHNWAHLCDVHVARLEQLPGMCQTAVSASGYLIIEDGRLIRRWSS